MPISQLLIHGVPVECINQAAIAYHVPATLIVSVLQVEGGSVGMAKPNTNGAFDYGPMQVNTIWLKQISPYGVTQEQLQYSPCINVSVGAWILSQRIADDKNTLWHGVAGYHSLSSNENLRYQSKVTTQYKNIMQQLNYTQN